MEKLGFNCVRMGEFAWSWFEPREGEYNFEPMRRAVQCAGRHGISVIMGTVSAVCPPWLYKKHPEVKGGNKNGDYNFGGRKGQCLSSKIFLSYAEKITAEQLKALGDCPEIIGWQLDNEPGFPFWDFDDRCQAGFREFLKDKYKTVDNLNRSWFTMMWSNVYGSFDEIQIPVNAAEGGWSAEIQLDYRRYFSFTFLRLLGMEAEIIRKYSPGRFIYTNWPGANWSVNCFEGSRFTDFAAWDNYVGQPNGENYRIQLRASMEHSFDRYLSNGKNKFLVAEQSPTTDANTPRDVMAAQTWLNVSHGAFATLFFEWRSATGGLEQGGNMVLAKNGRPYRETERVLTKLTGEIKKYYPLFARGKTNSDIAVVYSYENSWGSPGWVVDGPYDEEFFNAYGGFKNKSGNNVDVIGIDADLSRYKIIVLPSHRILTENDADRLKKYIDEGGILVLSCESGTREETNQMRRLLYPGLLREAAGAFVSGEISSSAFEKQTGKKQSAVFADGTRAVPGELLFTLETEGAESLAEYEYGYMKGKCFAAKNSLGRGLCITYGSNYNDVFFYEALAEEVLGLAGIKPLLDAPDGVLVSSRSTENGEYIFAVNMKDKPCVIRTELETVKDEDITVNGTEITLCPYGTVILKK